MLKYLTRRLMGLPLVALGVTALTFSIMHLMPGDPAELIARAKYGEELTPDQIEDVRKAEYLDVPIPLQYVLWLKKIAVGNLGISISSRKPVFSEISARLPATLQLAAAALVISAFMGISLGLVCASRRGTLVDDAGMSLALLGVSMPNFWLALLLILLFTLHLGWLPSFGSGDLRHLILPAVTLGTGLAALTARVMRSSTVEVLSQNYIRTARAYGLREITVVGKYAMKNAFIPVITIMGLQFGRLMEGVVIAEMIFGWPGIGRLLVNSIMARDFAVVQGCVLVIAVIFVAANLLVDMLYARLDPRIRYGED